MSDKSLWTGYSEVDGSPILRVSIMGSNGETEEFDGIIDTGFDGFVSIPQLAADRLGLVPINSEKVMFADNSEHIRWLAIATVIMGTEMQKGSVFLEPSSEEVLLRMEFIRKFDRMMLLYPTEGFVQFVAPSAAKSITSTFRP
jgi:predicted aspartyl protease